MTDKCVDFEVSKLSKEKGFWLYTANTNDYKWLDNDSYCFPTQCLLQKWLREILNIKVFVEPYVSGYKWRLYYNDMKDGIHGFTLHETWEAALEEGLFEGLKLIP